MITLMNYMTTFVTKLACMFVLRDTTSAPVTTTMIILSIGAATTTVHRLIAIVVIAIFLGVHDNSS